MKTDDDAFNLEKERMLVKDKAIKASKVLKKIDPKIYQLWNLVLAEKRLYLILDKGKPDLH